MPSVLAEQRSKNSRNLPYRSKASDCRQQFDRRSVCQIFRLTVCPKRRRTSVGIRDSTWMTMLPPIASRNGI